MSVDIIYDCLSLTTWDCNALKIIFVLAHGLPSGNASSPNGIGTNIVVLTDTAKSTYLLESSTQKGAIFLNDNGSRQIGRFNRIDFVRRWGIREIAGRRCWRR